LRGKNQTKRYNVFDRPNEQRYICIIWKCDVVQKQNTNYMSLC
jgi:hypothetical protein